MANLKNNRISMTISEEQMTSLKEAIAFINQSMDFLLALTPDERLRLPKIDKSKKIFVEDVVYSVQTNRDILPGYIEPTEMEKDLKLYRQLDELRVLVDNISVRMRDTQMLAGSEAYTTALKIYRMYDVAAKGGVPNAQSAYSTLKTHFASLGTPAKQKSTHEPQSA